jgi:hypothetical protein
LTEKLKKSAKSAFWIARVLSVKAGNTTGMPLATSLSGRELVSRNGTGMAAMGAEEDHGQAGSACRALLPVGPARPQDSGPRRTYGRSSAVFLAHLIATAKDCPQTREKRRLAPAEALRLYVATGARAQPKRVRLASL